MSELPRDLVERYAAAVTRYLADRDEPALAEAYEIGRGVLADGLGVLAMATLHAGTLACALQPPLTDAARTERLAALEMFFAEALSPFEMAHRGFREANVALHRLNDVLEAQARRIAHALHDEAAQLVAASHLALADATVVAGAAPRLTEAFQRIKASLDQIEGRLRHISHELRPPILDDLGLVPALEFLADSVAKRWGLPVDVDAEVGGGLPPIIETTVYRVVQEAVTNAARHAQATRTSVRLRRSAGRVACSIGDDGIGLDFEAVTAAGRRTGLGLVEIRERVAALGGTLRVTTNGSRGAMLSFELPLER